MMLACIGSGTTTAWSQWRTFRRDLLAKARGKFAKDDRYSYASVYLKMDEGGTDWCASDAAAAANAGHCKRGEETRRGLCVAI